LPEPKLEKALELASRPPRLHKVRTKTIKKA
jgi:hypothetical protein